MARGCHLNYFCPSGLATYVAFQRDQLHKHIDGRDAERQLAVCGNLRYCEAMEVHRNTAEYEYEYSYESKSKSQIPYSNWYGFLHGSSYNLCATSTNIGTRTGCSR
eukprot:scaffold429292_cov38-Prasinocladus_malaysianus.AAC.2